MGFAFALQNLFERLVKLILKLGDLLLEFAQAALDVTPYFMAQALFQLFADQFFQSSARTFWTNLRFLGQGQNPGRLSRL